MCANINILDYSAIAVTKDFYHICMQISEVNLVKDLSAIQSRKPLALSIGMFDGVHRGHQCIMRELIRVSDADDMDSGILTFWPHPRMVFDPDAPLRLLNTIDEKSALIRNFGIQHLFIQQFDQEFRNLTGEEFVREILVKKLNVRHVIVGYDHVFGKNRSGDFKLLEKLGAELGFSVQKMEAVNHLNSTISSTKIRSLLEQGHAEAANEMLGYPYALSGTVVHGKKLGRTIGYPTANIKPDEVKLLPKKGAYIVEVTALNKLMKGMLSISTNPTVNGEQLTVEVYILGLDHEIYGEKITVRFRKFLHEEIKFENLEQLTARLDEDRKLTEAFIL